jgi:hypothetical protein
MHQLYDALKRSFHHCPVVRVSTSEGYIPFWAHVEWAVPRIRVRGRCIRHGGRLRASRHRCVYGTHARLDQAINREKIHAKLHLTDGLRIQGRSHMVLLAGGMCRVSHVCNVEDAAVAQHPSHFSSSLPSDFFYPPVSWEAPASPANDTLIR